MSPFLDPETGERLVIPSQPKPSVPTPTIEPRLSEAGLLVVMKRIPGLTKGRLQRFTFQVPPLEEFSREISHTHTRYDTLAQGQQSRPGVRQLQTVQYRTCAVDWDASWTTIGAVDPLEINDLLEDICEAGYPFSLIVGQPSLWGRNEFSWPATLDSLRITERAGEIDTRYYDLAFTEFDSPEVISRRKKK